MLPYKIHLKLIEKSKFWFYLDKSVLIIQTAYK